MPRNQSRNKEQKSTLKGKSSSNRKQNSSSSRGGLNKRSLKSSIINFLRNQEGKVLKFNQIASEMGMHNHAERDALLSILAELLTSGMLLPAGEDMFAVPKMSESVIGRVDGTKTGAGYIIVEGMDEDIYIPSGKMNKAFHGDTVRVEYNTLAKKGKKEGEVVEIVQRKKIEFTGKLEIAEGKFGFVVPDGKNMNVDFFIPKDKLKGAANGMKVLVRMNDWPEKAKNPYAEVIRVLGIPGEHNTEMNSIIAEFNLPEEFPDAVERESKAIPLEISEDEISKRWDFRTVPTFTIDPADAKDFDDALSIQMVGQGLWEIGVHIADVSHYVKPFSELDKEALNRATSVYLVDRVIPMLPERLSNGVCSLRPNEDKLTFSAVFVMNEQAEIKKEWFGKTIINSQKRFSYEDAQEILEGKDGMFKTELHKINDLALILKDDRFKHGSISFETEEVKFNLDEEGNPTGVYKKVRKDAHKLIEEFMLLANKKVAEYAFKQGGTDHLEDHPFPYRVHDSPNKEKLENFALVAARFGYKMNLQSDATVAKSLNQLLMEVEGKPEQNMLQAIAIRSMAKAFYTIKKSGHYGLGFEYYAHFTSPIRRYPDVIAHRLLELYLNDKHPFVDAEWVESECKQSSEMEIRASEAERASIKYKQCQYMSKHIGDEFLAVLSGVTEWGIYAEIKENKCEGMIRITDLKGDHYVFDESTFSVKGFKTGQKYTIGDEVKVKISSVNLSAKTIDMAFVK